MNGQLVRLRRVMSTHSQFAWNVGFALPVVVVQEGVQVVVPKVELDSIGCQLAARLTLKGTGSIDHDQSSSIVQ